MRYEVMLTDDEIANLFDEAFYVLVDVNDLVFSRDTIADFEATIRTYNDAGKTTHGQECGYDTLEVNAVQVRAGEDRKGLYVIDFGPARASLLR